MAATYPALREALLDLTLTLTSSRSAELETLAEPPASGFLPALDPNIIRARASTLWADAKARLEQRDAYRIRHPPSEGLVKNGESSKSATPAPAEPAEGVKKEASVGEPKAGDMKLQADAAVEKQETQAGLLEQKRSDMVLDLVRSWMELAGRELVVLPIVSGEVCRCLSHLRTRYRGEVTCEPSHRATPAAGDQVWPKRSRSRRMAGPCSVQAPPLRSSLRLPLCSVRRCHERRRR